jgi:S-adenosylmethionine:tRNA ribosyltransferase-isomerase
MDLRTDDFDYHLPPELIAQEPTERREQARLLVLDRSTGTMTHDRVSGICRYLHAGDLLVANRSRVLPARLHAKKATGGAVELLLLASLGSGRWKALARPSRKLRASATLSIDRSRLTAVIEEELGEGAWVVRFEGEGDVESQVRAAGTLPLPPYIRNPAAPLDRYQTVYADQDGSIAAPTAGLHFSLSLLDEIREHRVRVELVTLHVGAGTFKPVAVDRVQDHRIHAEWGEVPAGVADAVNRTRAAGGRVIAVGTTTTRLLESAASGGELHPFCGETDLFIYPGYHFQAIDGLVTNFHLPRSSLLMMVSAFAGRERTLAAYAEAARHSYRFYSFGDAMLILSCES